MDFFSIIFFPSPTALPPSIPIYLPAAAVAELHSWGRCKTPLGLWEELMESAEQKVVDPSDKMFR